MSGQDGDGNVHTVEARIPASSSSQREYKIEIYLADGGRSIFGSNCSCPIGYKCKHIHKVLCRIAGSKDEPLPGPNNHQKKQLDREKLCEKQFRRGTCVYLAFACQSELDSESDYRRSAMCKDKFDEQLLGVFFSVAQANKCARNYVEDELEMDIGEGDDEDELKEEDAEEEDAFVWDGSDYDEYDGSAFDKVWVECRAIEDASKHFHR